ncbi:MAG: DAK2 domain-containing protein, partial [Ruminococcus sp.]|nr:DAK2 domain-containing protein [Ruminococcus sp.]
MINGSLLRDAFISGAVTIANKKREVDELNVYPVPDGDTGTNMSMTMSAAIAELKRLSDNVTVSEVASVTASALLRGARGNSGVILSLIFRGFAKGLAGCEEAGCDDIANALELGVDAAYKAVMKPTEGTILTVSKAAAIKAQEIANSTNDTTVLWQEICAEANSMLQKTPDMLPVLKKAGVVDAGGQGLVIIFDAILDVLKGGAIAVSEEKSSSEASKEQFRTAVSEYDEEINFTYCTEYIVQKSDESSDP